MVFERPPAPFGGSPPREGETRAKRARGSLTHHLETFSRGYFDYAHVCRRPPSNTFAVELYCGKLLRCKERSVSPTRAAASSAAHLERKKSARWVSQKYSCAGTCVL